MGNRSMAAKRQKIKRMKRTFPKSYCSNYIPTGGGTDRERMLMAGYKEHARGLAFDSTYLQWLEDTARFKGKTPCRVEVEAHIRRIENVAPTKMCFKLMENGTIRVRCFFNSEKTHWIIMEEDFKKGHVRTSMSYFSKDSIVYAWKKDTIKWVEITHKSISREVLAPPLSTG